MTVLAGSRSGVANRSGEEEREGVETPLEQTTPLELAIKGKKQVSVNKAMVPDWVQIGLR